MASDPYRGDEAARAARLVALDEEIAKLEAVLTPVFWARVAPTLRVDAPGSPLSGEPLEARQRRVAALSDAIARARAGIRAADERPPSEPRREGGALDPALDDRDVVRNLKALASESPDAEINRRARDRWGVRTRSEGVPIDATVRRVPANNGTYWEWRLYTSCVPDARLHMKAEGILQDLLEMLGLGEEIELGDPELDPVFEIKGDERSARALLTPRVRRDLLDLNVASTVVLAVDRGCAELALHPLAPSSVPLAVRILRELHRAPSHVPLVRMPGTPSS